MSPTFRTLDPIDVKISDLVGLETYKALYFQWKDLYSYISDPLVPTKYFSDLVSGVVASSELSFVDAGIIIKETLTRLVNQEEITKENAVLVSSLVGSSYKIENLNSTPWENIIWISVVVFLSFWVIWYLYAIGFWDLIFNLDDGIACYDCPSIFDRLLL